MHANKFKLKRYPVVINVKQVPLKKIKSVYDFVIDVKRVLSARNIPHLDLAVGCERIGTRNIFPG